MTVAPSKSGQPCRLTNDESFYPSGDGKPMAENDQCRLQAIYCIDTLLIRYQQRMDVYVAGDNFLYYEEGNPRKVVSPDVYVVFGVEKRVRMSYMTWHENGVVPAMVMEITSQSTAKEDVKKRSLYEKLGIAEYFQFDPNGDYLDPRLQGFRLLKGNYVPISPEIEPLPATASNQPRSIHLRSHQLGLDLAIEGEWLRFYDVITGEPLLSASELAQKVTAEAQARAIAERRAATETQRAEQAEAELVRLRAELEALRHGRIE